MQLNKFKFSVLPRWRSIKEKINNKNLYNRRKIKLP